MTSLQLTLQNEAGLDLRPFRSLSVGVDVSQARDLRDYGDTSTIGILARQDGRRFAGLDLGFERRRSVRTRLSYQPDLAAWLRPRAMLTSGFTLSRDPNAGAVERDEGDSTGAFHIPRAFENQRSADVGASVDLGRLVGGLLGDSSFVTALAERVSAVDLSTNSERRSQFNRRGFSPDLSYQLALGGVGGFREREGQFADAAIDSREVRAATGVRLPLGTSVTADYSSRRMLTWARRGEGQSEMRQTERSWPGVAARWTWSPTQTLVRRVIGNVSGSVGYRVRETESMQLAEAASGSAAGVLGRQTTTSWPVSAAITWAARITTNLSVSESRVEADRSGNRTESDRSETSADLSFAFRPPQELIPLRSDVRTSLRYANSVTQVCIVRAGTAECVAISDSRRRQVNLTLDTDMPPNMSAGLSVSYIRTEDAHMNRRFAQFIVTASVTIAFTAGEIR